MTVWIFVALVSSGHLVNSVVPTTEFRTPELCEKFKADLAKGDGSSRGYCLRVQK